ncbi:hypothetical protein C3F00_046975, partial [Pseudomonas sp. MWU13-2860]
HADSALSIPAFTLMGVSLAIFLGFRNSVSYERFWEARKLWGSLVIVNRSLARQALSLAPDNADAQRLIDGCCAFASALKAQLRGDDPDAHLRRLLPEEILSKALAARFKPALILAWLGQLTARMRRDGALNDMQWHALDRNL